MAGTTGMIESSVVSVLKSCSLMTFTAVSVALPVLMSLAVTAVFSAEAYFHVASRSSVGRVYGFVGMATRSSAAATAVSRWTSRHSSEVANVGTHSSPAFAVVETRAFARASARMKA